MLIRKIMGLLGISLTFPLWGLGHAPIQQVDVVNLLGTGGGTPTPIVLSFATDASAIPCFTTTLAFQGATTVLAGMERACTTAITSIAVTPLAGGNGLVIYDEPLIPTSINGNYYLTQITVSQNTAPVFDSGNGSLITPGTLQVITQSHWARTTY